MSKSKRPVGRPAAFEVGSRMVRLPEDLADMVSWLASIEGVTVAQIIDPLVRPVVSKRYADKYPAIRAIKKAKDDALALAGKSPTPALPQLNTSDVETGEMVTLEELARRQEERAADPKSQGKKKPKP